MKVAALCMRAVSLTAAIVASTLLAVVAAGTARATVLTSGCANANQSCTLEELFQGGTITVNDKLFSNWTLDELTVATVRDIADIDEIIVSGLADGGLDPGPGLSFNSFTQIEAQGDFSGLNTGKVDLVFSFDVTALGDFQIVDNSLGLTAASFFSGDGGFVGIVETVFDAAANQIGVKEVFEDNLAGTSDSSDELNFAPQSQIHIELDILVLTDNPFPEIAALDGFEMRFSQVQLPEPVPEPVPEPATILLFGFGLAGLGLMRRRRLT